MRALAAALILKERIYTTEARAKELRPKIEKLVTKAKKGTLALRREVLRGFDRKTTGKLFGELAPRFQERAGGYTRIIKLPPRKSDGARLAIIEFV